MQITGVGAERLLYGSGFHSTKIEGVEWLAKVIDKSVMLKV